MTDQYAVFGNPIEHSKSPEIHTFFAEQTQQDLEYSKQLVELDGFSSAVAAFKAAGGKGINITVPFKLEAYELADRLSQRARQAGAVNTLILHDDSTVEGDNTDGIGMVNDIVENHGWPMAGKIILVLGAGGAVRGVLGPMLAQKPAKIIIANRTLEKAQQLATAFSKIGCIEALGFDEIPAESVDMVINGTSASLSGDIPPVPAAIIGVDTACYDMMYGKEYTAFLQWAQQQGATKLADGLGMLVGQAAEAFTLWRKVRPDVNDLINELRAKM
ncbi:MAG: shikimate dehydrogenase [Pseudomonadales bacterium]|nr:shikimate dehydrogenase [Pseudomonadales bacterium]